jgi:hypothetical protein
MVKSTSKLIYLASPYSKYPHGRVHAEAAVSTKAAELMSKGVALFCPITHSHWIEQHMDSVQDGDWWLEKDFAVLERCDELWVYQMPGWDESYGVKKEIEFAEHNNIPITYVPYEELQPS